MKKYGKRLLALALSLVLLITLVPISASAYTLGKLDDVNTSASNPTYYPSGCLKSIDVSVKRDGGNYATAYGKIAVHNGLTAFHWGNRFLPYTQADSWPSDMSRDTTFLAFGAGGEIEWTDYQLHTMTLSFADGEVAPGTSGDNTYYIILWTRSTRYGIYPDAILGTLKFGENLKLDDTVIPDTTQAHTCAWYPTTNSGFGTKEAVAVFACNDPKCGAARTVTLTASDVTLPGEVFNAKITVENTAASSYPDAKAAALKVSTTPGYKYSAAGSDFTAVDPTSFQAKAGVYQASIMIVSNGADVNPVVKYTVIDPVVTAATGDNRPVEMMFMGLAAFSLLAVAAFVLDRKGAFRR